MLRNPDLAYLNAGPESQLRSTAQYVPGMASPGAVAQVILPAIADHTNPKRPRGHKPFPRRHAKTRRSFMPSGRWHKGPALPRQRGPSKAPVSGGETGREASQLNRRKAHAHCKLCLDTQIRLILPGKPARGQLRAGRVARIPSKNLPLCATLYRQVSAFFRVQRTECTCPFLLSSP